MRRWRSALRRFSREEDGSYTLEAVLVLPMLIWASIAGLTYVDGFRMQNLNLRTTYSLADMLSRQKDPVGPAFVAGLGRLHDYLSAGDDETFLRVTVVFWDAAEEVFQFVWSDSTADGPLALTRDTLDTISGAIPAMADGDTAIVVETWMDFTPPFRIGLGESRFYNRVVTSPRYAPQLRYDPLK